MKTEVINLKKSGEGYIGGEWRNVIKIPSKKRQRETWVLGV